MHLIRLQFADYHFEITPRNRQITSSLLWFHWTSFQTWKTDDLEFSELEFRKKIIDCFFSDYILQWIISYSNVWVLFKNPSQLSMPNPGHINNPLRNKIRLWYVFCPLFFHVFPIFLSVFFPVFFPCFSHLFFLFFFPVFSVFWKFLELKKIKKAQMVSFLTKPFQKHAKHQSRKGGSPEDP